MWLGRRTLNHGQNEVVLSLGNELDEFRRLLFLEGDTLVFKVVMSVNAGVLVTEQVLANLIDELIFRHLSQIG